jgi:WD40 repeat protein
MWARRKRALAALILVGILSGLMIGFFLVQRAEVEAERSRLEQKLLRLQELRRPTRKTEWFTDYQEHVRSLRHGGTAADPTLQAQAAAALEGFDSHALKSIPGFAPDVKFDPQSKHLLFVRGDLDEMKRPRIRTMLWDRAADRMIAERDLGQGVVAFRPDGTPIQASRDAADKSRVRLLDVSSGEEIRTLRSPLEGPSIVSAITLSRDGSRLAAVVRPGKEDPDDPRDGPTTLVAWDVSSDRPLRTLAHKATQGVVLSPDGRFLAAWDSSGEITVWTLPDGKELPRFHVGRMPVSCLAFGRDPVWHDDGPAPPWLLAVGESSGLITVWDLDANRPRSICRGSNFGVDSMDFSDDGALLLSGGRTPAKLWDVATGTCLLNIRVGDYVGAIAFAPDGFHLALGSWHPAGPSLEVVELERGHGVNTLYGLQGVVQKTTFSPDGRFIAGASHEWQVGLWEADSGRLVGILPAPIGRFADSIGMAFDADGGLFACSVGHQARLWDVKERRLIRPWELPAEGLCDSIAFAGRDHLLLVRQETKDRRGAPFNSHPPKDFPRVVRLYDLLGTSPTQPIAEINAFDWHIHDIEIAPDGSFFAVDGLGKEGQALRRRFHVYKAPSGEFVRDLPTRLRLDMAGWIIFDPSSKVLAAGLDPVGPLELFELPALTFRGAAVADVDCVGPGAERSIGVASEGGSHLVLIDLITRRRFLRIVEDVGANQQGFRFSPDGRRVTVSRSDGTVSVLDLVEINRRLTEFHLGW